MRRMATAARSHLPSAGMFAACLIASCVPATAQTAPVDVDLPAAAPLVAAPVPCAPVSPVPALEAPAPEPPVAEPAPQIAEAGPAWLAEQGAASGDTTDLPAVEPPAPCIPLPVRPPAPDMFGFAATPIAARTALQKWQQVDLASLEGLAGPWDEMLDQARLLAGDEQLDMVNRWVNWHVRFTDDSGSDEWASAGATLRRGSGDCEDFALAKMALLARAGRPGDDLVLVLVRDRLRSLDHAVLAVRTNGSFRILDNRSDTMRWAEDIDDYLPTLGYSGTFAWIYGRRYAGGGSMQPGAAQLP